MVRFWLALFAALALVSTARAAPSVQTTWQLLDYLAVDYSGAVKDGKVVSESEYAEMREFSATISEQVAALPNSAAKPKLIAGSKALQSAIGSKAEPPAVARIAHVLAAGLLKAYPVSLAPAKVPNLKRGAALYKENCASCHGIAGAADTEMARQLDPAPIAFTDRDRAAKRTPFALYQVISNGIPETAMASWSQLSADERWALAYHAGTLAYPNSLVERGRSLWNDRDDLHALVPDLAALSALSEDELATKIGDESAAALVAYLRSDPGAVAASESPLQLARERLAQSLAAYRSGDRERAKSLALSAYLDGFEPVEPALSARDGELLSQVESAMAKLRSDIAAGASVDAVAADVDSINALLGDSEGALAPDSGSSVSSFVGGFTILLREGLEALLIVIAMLAFLRKADRRDMERPVHYGWAAALTAGGLTWVVATSLISISGAGRELTEGFGSLFAAVVLVFVGIWMHGKAQAGQWQRYIHDRMNKALGGRASWLLFGLAFIAVYREIFETILFYAAMAAQGHVEALVAGAVAATVVLAAIAIAMLRFSQRLPIAMFFAFSSALVAILAVVLAGKGAAALQEAGLLGVHSLPSLPRIDLLGLFPTSQTVALQVLVLVVLAAGFSINRRLARARSPG
jgi:high-affinity iron transporter